MFRPAFKKISISGDSPFNLCWEVAQPACENCAEGELARVHQVAGHARGSSLGCHGHLLNGQASTQMDNGFQKEC